MEKVFKAIPATLRLLKTQTSRIWANIFSVIRHRNLSVWSSYCKIHPVRLTLDQGLQGHWISENR